MTISVLFVFSAFRPYSFPVCYALLALCAITGHKKRIKLPRLEAEKLGFLAILSIYVTTHSSVSSSPFLQTFALNGAGILSAVLILSFIRNEGNLIYLLLGSAPIMVLDSLVEFGRGRRGRRRTLHSQTHHIFSTNQHQSQASLLRAFLQQPCSTLALECAKLFSFAENQIQVLIERQKCSYNIPAVMQCYPQAVFDIAQ